MNMIGHLYGMGVHTSEHCMSRSTGFTRKQTRKFKNHRWVKKYLKKYSYEIQTPTMVQYHDKMIMHPKVWEQLKIQLEEQRNAPPSPSDMYHRPFGANRF